ncbi:MAG: hypothetical protein WCL14_13055 [Bacteroidota bacterium]
MMPRKGNYYKIIDDFIENENDDGIISKPPIMVRNGTMIGGYDFIENTNEAMIYLF